MYATKSKNFKQLLKSLKNWQHLCSLERYLKNLLCNNKNIRELSILGIRKTITTWGKMFKRKHKSALFYVANVGTAKVIVEIYLKLYYSFFYNPWEHQQTRFFLRCFSGMGREHSTERRLGESFLDIKSSENINFVRKK